MVTWQDSLVLSVALLATTSFLLVKLVKWLRAESTLHHVTPEDFGLSVGFDLRAPSEFRWSKVYAKAAEKFRAPFRVLMSGGRKMTVFPPSYIDELKNNKSLSFDQAIVDSFPSYVPGFRPMSYLGSNPTIIHKVLKTKLTRELGEGYATLFELDTDTLLVNYTEALTAEARDTLPILLPHGQSWQEMVPKDTILGVVARLSSTIFLGRNFEHREKWLEISSTYSLNMFHAQRILAQWSPWLRPIVHWFLPEFQLIKKQQQEAAALIEPEVKARREKRAQAEVKGAVVNRLPDSVDWFEDVRQGKELDFVSAQLLLLVVAIETTTHTLTNAILDIVSQPKLLEDIRKEIATIIKEDGGVVKTTPAKAKLLDSAVKESQRLHPLDQVLILRVATNDITLRDGTKIAKSDTIQVAPLPQFNSELYPNPYVYDGYRFFNLRQTVGNETKWQLATTQAEHIGFGHGIHACPGRFFASNAMKIALMHMLMKYDWKFPEGQGRPKEYEVDTALIADPAARLLYQPRTSEIDF